MAQYLRNVEVASLYSFVSTCSMYFSITFPIPTPILNHKATGTHELSPRTLFWRVTVPLTLIFKNSTATVNAPDILLSSLEPPILFRAETMVSSLILHIISQLWWVIRAFHNSDFHYCRAWWGWRKSERRVTSPLKQRGRHNSIQKESKRERLTKGRRKETPR